MKQILPLFLLLFFLILACVPSKPLDLEGLSNAQFETLTLKASYELYNLRIDILRQEDCEENIDSTTSWVSRPYHPVGFDLGNGLFFDLNYNLSLRIDQSLGLENQDSFELKEVFDINRETGFTYAITENKFCRFINHIRKKNKRTCYGIERQEESISVFTEKERHCYTIEENDNSLIYVPHPARRKFDKIIFREDVGEYLLKKKRYNDTFTQEGNEINLDNNYLIKRSKDGKLLEVLSIRKKSNYLLYSIQKSDNIWYVYNQQKHGKMIRIKAEEIEVIRNEEVVYRASLEKG